MARPAGWPNGPATLVHSEHVEHIAALETAFLRIGRARDEHVQPIAPGGDVLDGEGELAPHLDVVGGPVDTPRVGRVDEGRLTAAPRGNDGGTGHCISQGNRVAGLERPGVSPHRDRWLDTRTSRVDRVA